MNKLNLPAVSPKKEQEKIVQFIKNILEKEKFTKAVIGLSGGIDSLTCFYLLREALPPQNIYIAHLYYFQSQFARFTPILKKAAIPQNNLYNLSIKNTVDTLKNQLKIGDDKIRLGNLMARTRMIYLYDLAKKHQALVAGTENRSEHLLGYFTRFGDEASDIEPIRHLYKTQVYQLASYLKVPKYFISQPPTAGLWHNQTDEGEFGFSYQEADLVLYLYFDKKLPVKKIKELGYKNARKIINFTLNNRYKHQVPYSL